MAYTYIDDATKNTRVATVDILSENPFRFSSEYFDSELGLVYYNYRHYNPEVGRWLSRDPIEEVGGNNLYGMCDNNTINSFDIYGLLDPNSVSNYSRYEFPISVAIALLAGAQITGKFITEKGLHCCSDGSKKMISEYSGDIKLEVFLGVGVGIKVGSLSANLLLKGPTFSRSFAVGVVVDDCTDVTYLKTKIFQNEVHLGFNTLTASLAHMSATAFFDGYFQSDGEIVATTSSANIVLGISFKYNFSLEAVSYNGQVYTFDDINGYKLKGSVGKIFSWTI